jgi:hypothetical protein
MDNRDYPSNSMKTVGGQLLRIWALLTVERSGLDLLVAVGGSNCHTNREMYCDTT